MFTTLFSSFLTGLVQAFSKTIRDLLFSLAGRMLYIDSPTKGSEEITKSFTFYNEVKNKILIPALKDEDTKTVIYINQKAQKITFLTYEEWKRHPFYDCSNIEQYDIQLSINLTLIIALLTTEDE